MPSELLPAGLGAIVGVVLALSGAGGGILAVPLLVLVLGLPMQAAAPVGLMAVGLAAGIGAAFALREGILRYRAAALIGLVGMLVAPAGVWLAQHLPNAPLLIGFSGVLAYIGWRSIRQAASASPEGVECHGQPCKIDPNVGRLLWTLPCARALAGTGIVSGLLSGMLGVGGGFVIVPALGRHTDLEVRSIVATSLGVITLVALGGIAAAAWHGSIQWPVAWPFTLGAVSGLLGGRRFAQRLAGTRQRQIFGVVCLVVAVILLARGAGWLTLGR